jgi:hypothetical protein
VQLVSLLQTPRSNDSIQTELHDLLGCAANEFIARALTHRSSLQELRTDELPSASRPSDGAQTVVSIPAVVPSSVSAPDPRFDKSSLRFDPILQMETMGRLWRSAPVKSAEVSVEIAKKVNYFSGKWMVYASRNWVDHVWSKITVAICTGRRSATTAKVASAMSDPAAGGSDQHVICIYTDDFRDKSHVMKVRGELRELGIKQTIHYKADIYTSLDVYAKNPWKLKPSIYSS